MGLDTTRARLKSYTDDAPGLDYIIKRFIPLIIECGLDCHISNKIFVDNPSKALSISKILE
jgi:predicted metal-dependent phosphotriesterase family hydrolase